MANFICLLYDFIASIDVWDVLFDAMVEWEVLSCER